MVRLGNAFGIGSMVALLLAFGGTSAMAQDAEFGKGVWLSQANCADCHGWLGDGDNADPRSPRGANLRETAMAAEDIVNVILCGIPGTGMPHFDPKAYTDDRCYGMTRADMGDQTPNAGAMALTKRHATGLANFIIEEFVGKGEPTKEECVALLGAESSHCSKLN